MNVEVSRRTALRYGLLGMMAVVATACSGGGLTSPRQQALRQWATGTWNVEVTRNGNNRTTGTVTVNDDGTWTSTVDLMYLEHGGTWATDGGELALVSRTRNDGVNYRTKDFTLTGVPEEVGEKASATPQLLEPADTIIRRITVDGDTLSLEADYQTRGRASRTLHATATRQ